MNSIKSEEIPHSRSQRPFYSSTQLSACFTQIGLPESYLSSNPNAPGIAHTEDHGLAFVTALMRHHLAAIPFENLSMHYSHNQCMTLDMPDIYSIFTEQGRCRVGHCLQMNGLFGTVLSSLGFQVTAVAARVNTACQAVGRTPGYKGPSYNGWDHMVNIVTLSSRRYLVDVGMGARGPMVPLEMVPGASATTIPPRAIRLPHGYIPEHTSPHPSNALWKLEMRNSEGSAWVPTYAFTEMEFLPQDFEVMNWYVSINPRSWFTHKILVVRMVLDTGKQHIIGDVTMFERTLVKRIHGQVEVEIECRSEQQRMDLLWTWIGIILTDPEQKAIVSTVSEIL